ncbi:thiamine pyrophosphate-dependent enzyme [Thalassotalea aquiviva]|uniref:thiamine pyrophosphate-dependent enzyme n=1 Tax=Thalassotalea aquiviva TaxID=3242415 RepID=UPI00352B70C2
MAIIPFSTAKLMPIYHPYSFISPTDFNCMGYATPAAIACKLAAPDKDDVAIVANGAFMMSCMELAIAVAHNIGVVICVFNNSERSQLSQAQQISYNRKTCTVLPQAKVKGIAIATGVNVRQNQ